MNYKKINVIKKTGKIIKEKYLINNYSSDSYLKIIRNNFNIDNEQNIEDYINEINKYDKEIKKIKNDGLEQLFKNIEKEINKIMI